MRTRPIRSQDDPVKKRKGVRALQYTWGKACQFDMAAIPKAAAQQLRLASAPQIKVLVWLACAGQGRFDAAVCAAACGVSPAVCEEAFAYWMQGGVIDATVCTPAETATASESAPSPVPAIPVAPAPEPNEPTPTPTPAVGTLGGAPACAAYPSRAQAVQKKAEDAAFSALLETAAVKLGKILSPSDMSVFLYLYRELALPPEVILMVIGYAVQNGKGKMAYIEKTAIGWAEDGITTFEAADAHLQKLEQCAQAWDTLCEWHEPSVARPTVAQKEIARRWIIEWQFPREVVDVIVEVTVKKTGKFQMAYADRIAERLHALGITSAAAAREELTAEKKPTKKAPSKSRMKTATDRAPSYNIADYEKMVRRHRPTPPKED